uniref:Putative secreted protein n=1 Tax=Amblyomma triste TaxID=251400 RepID=A0A023G445_AMBTT
MKAVSVLLFLVAITSAYSAAVEFGARSKERSLNEALTVQNNAALLKETGQTMETIGKVLQGQLSQISVEEQAKLLQVLTALNTPEASEESDEYFITVAGVLQFIVSSLITKGVAFGVSAALG